jgi:glycosyltransferase involved in cell wall biosynthesis
VINNGVDIKRYTFHSKIRVKKELGIPLNRKTVLISAGNLEDPRKGITYALKGLKLVRDNKPHILMMGVPSFKLEKQLVEYGLTYTSFGYLDDPIELSRRYAAADLFLFCSLADNQPLAVLESLASGTPVIGFATGGIPELIDFNTTGILVPPKNINELGSALRYALEQAPLDDWSKLCREAAKDKFSYETYITNHISLYDRILRS